MNKEEYLFSPNLYINHHGIYFITGDRDQPYVNQLKNGTCTQIPLTKNLVHAVPLGKDLLVTEWLKLSSKPDSLISYIVDEDQVQHDLNAVLRLEDFCVLNEWVVEMCIRDSSRTVRSGGSDRWGPRR